MTSNANSSNASPFDPLHGSSSASTVRPRNRRLISVVDDDEENGNENLGVCSGLSPSSAFVTAAAPRSRSQNPSPSPASTRNPSPLPSKHPSRGTSSFEYRYHDSSSQRVRPGLGRGVDTKAPSFLGSSWTSLQGLAATVMGSDTSHGNSNGDGPPRVNGGQHRRKPSRAADSGSFRGSANGGQSRSPMPSAWGPSLLGLKPSPGSKEERDALVQAKRREALLQVNGDSMPDSRGVHKRRNSELNSASSTAMLEEDAPDALVYVHQVQPNDSLTGVSIRYGCPLGVVRKANGFWPSDMIQSKQTVVLPVDACSIKGRPIRTAEKEKRPMFDLMDDSPPGSSTLLPIEQSPYSEPEPDDLDGPLETGKSTKPAQTWKHECWVEVDGFTERVELGRVPCRALGYFPRGRRKSRSQAKPYSDIDDITSRSSSLTQPRDDPFSSSSDLRGQFSAIEICNSPERFRDRSTSSSQPSRPPHRHRRNRSSFTFNGPGGVGTLGGNVTGPGPAPDKLSNFINTHLPNLALPPAPTSQPNSNTSTPRPPRISSESTSSVVSNGSSAGFENVGGAIEGWFRKVATRAQTSINELQQPSQLYNHLGLGGNGDLIELDDTREGGQTGTPSRSRQERRGGSSTRRPRDNIRGRTMNSSARSSTWDVSRTKGD